MAITIHHYCHNGTIVINAIITTLYYQKRKVRRCLSPDLICDLLNSVQVQSKYLFTGDGDRMKLARDGISESDDL